MRNFIFISPNFPDVYYKFVTELKKQGFNVLGIGDGPYYEIPEQLKKDITEYYYVGSLSNFDDVCRAVEFFINKYGEIEYLESNNEYWLMQDALLREKYNIKNGLRPNNMDLIKFKSKMKQGFQKAGVKVARYVIANDINTCLDFIKEVDYPVFVKPDNGVGACNSYAIKNEEELISFFNSKDETTYIMEEFLEGEIVTFDGICDDESNVIISFQEHFPISNADVVNLNIDDFYYAQCEFDEEFKKMGQRLIKAFNLKKRCFHIEFFKLSKDKKGLANKNEIVGIEVNMRPPGGNTPEILSMALNASFYDCYAQIMANNKVDLNLDDKKYISISVARKDHFNYVHHHDIIMSTFSNNVLEHGRYNKEIALNMGDEYYFAKFDNVEDALKFQKFVQEKY